VAKRIEAQAELRRRNEMLLSWVSRARKQTRTQTPNGLPVQPRGRIEQPCEGKVAVMAELKQTKALNVVLPDTAKVENPKPRNTFKE